MRRREEVEKEIVWIESGGWDTEREQWPQVARTLADEVDALRKENERIKQNHGCARHQNTTQFCVEVAERDAVITKLLAMLEPGEKHPKWGHGICESCGWHGCFSLFVGRAGGELQDDDESLCPVCEDTVQDVDRSIYVNLYARACEIAGRVK